MIGPKSAAMFIAFLASLCALVLCVIDTAAAQTCTFSVSPVSVSAGVHGLPDPDDPRAGAGQPPKITVTANKADCSWAASTTASWIQLLASSGSGSGYVQYKVTGNNTGAPRTGTIQVAGSTVTIRQDSDTVCTVYLSPKTVSVREQGAPESTSDPRGRTSVPPKLTVTTSKQNCRWMASTRTPWIQLLDARGKGDGYIRYTVMKNTSGSPRTGTIEVDRQTVTISQEYSGACVFSVSPLKVSLPWQGTDQDPRGASRPFKLNISSSQARCEWTASTSSDWIRVHTAAGRGSGAVPYSVVPNNSDSPRTGTIRAAGKTLTIKQGARKTRGEGAGTAKSNCRASISPSSATVESKRSSGVFKVRTGDECPWTAQTKTPWIHITSGASSKGDGTVQYTVDENDGAKRTGAVTASGKTFRISQKASPALKKGKTSKGNRQKAVTKQTR